MFACRISFILLLPAIVSSLTHGLFLLQTTAHPKSNKHAQHRKSARNLARDHHHKGGHQKNAGPKQTGGPAAQKVAPAPQQATPLPPVAPMVPAANAIPTTVVNNLGGVGPNLGMPPVMTLGSLIKPDGTMVDVLVTNSSVYEPTDADQNKADFSASGWVSSAINVMGGTSVNLNFSFVDHATGLPTAIDRFVLSIVDIDESLTAGLSEMVIAKPDSFAVSPTTGLVISRTSTGDMVFAGSGGAEGPYPPHPMEMSQDEQDASVMLQYLNKQGFVLTLQVSQTNPFIRAMGTGIMGGRNFVFVGASQLETTGVMINTTLLNSTGQIASGSGLGVDMQPAPVVTAVPNASNASVAGAATDPFGNPLGIPLNIPNQSQLNPMINNVSQAVDNVSQAVNQAGAALSPFLNPFMNGGTGQAGQTAPNQTAVNATISTTPLIVPLSASASEPMSLGGPTGIPISVGPPQSATPLPLAAAGAQSVATSLMPSETVAPVNKNTPTFVCGSDNNQQEGFCPECTMSPMCSCNGLVRYGYEPYWTPWQDVNGVVECNSVTFGDVYPGHGKVCECAEPAASSGYWTGPEVAGMWWPILVVIVPATLLVSAVTVLRLVSAASPVKSLIEVTLEGSLPSVTFAPMVAALFVAAAKRGEYVLAGGAGAQSLLQMATGGSPDLSNFQAMDMCIKVCAAAFCCQVISRVVYEFLAARERARGPAISSPRDSTEGAWLLCHHVSVAVTYVTLAVLLTRLMMMGDMPFVAATLCTIILAVVFFGCYLALHLLTFSTYSEWGTAVAKLSVLNMQFGPMLSVLFIGMQVAAEAGTGAPVKPYVEDWMKICTASTLLQAALSILMSALFQAQLQNTSDDKEDLVVRRHEGVVLFSGIRWAAMAVLYLGVWKVCRAVWLADMVQGRAHALCLLTAIYFVTYAVMWLLMTLRQLSDFEAGAYYAHAIRHCVTATHLVAVCPMAAAFLVGWWIVTTP